MRKRQNQLICVYTPPFESIFPIAPNRQGSARNYLSRVGRFGNPRLLGELVTSPQKSEYLGAHCRIGRASKGLLPGPQKPRDSATRRPIPQETCQFCCQEDL